MGGWGAGSEARELNRSSAAAAKDGLSSPAELLCPWSCWRPCYRVTVSGYRGGGIGSFLTPPTASLSRLPCDACSRGRQEGSGERPGRGQDRSRGGERPLRQGKPFSEGNPQQVSALPGAEASLRRRSSSGDGRGCERSLVGEVMGALGARPSNGSTRRRAQGVISPHPTPLNLVDDPFDQADGAAGQYPGASACASDGGGELRHRRGFPVAVRVGVWGFRGDIH